VADNSITDNHARSGGGIFLVGATARITGNFIHANTAGLGGGIYDLGIRSKIHYNCIVGNSADSAGGGYYCFMSDPRLENNTITANEATAGGGFFAKGGSEPIITSTILWANQAGDGAEIHFSASTPDITYSDIGGGWEGEGNIDADPLFCDVSNMNFELAALSPCAGTGRDGADIGAHGIGCATTDVDAPTPDDLPATFNLSRNYPNPFNPATVIEYTLPERASVRLTIHNILGQKIRTLVDQTQPAGTHTAVWDGIDQSDHTVASGVYFYRIEAGDFTDTRKMVLVR
jgi:hypothetical protein